MLMKRAVDASKISYPTYLIVTPTGVLLNLTVKQLQVFFLGEAQGQTDQQCHNTFITQI